MIFKIRKGNHYSDGVFHKALYPMNFYHYSSYEVVFDKSCAYDLVGEDQKDINKLFGFSAGLNHHKDSARFGWAYNEGMIELWSYCYIGGERRVGYLCSVLLGESYTLDLSVSGSETCYRFIVHHKGSLYRSSEVYKDDTWNFGYNLWPYFGGNRPAPHDIQISLRSLI